MDKIKFWIITLLFLLVALNSQATTFVVETNTYLNIRLEPNTQAKIIGKLYNGDTVNVSNIQNGWALIKFNNRSGFISEKYITQISNHIDTEHSSILWIFILIILVGVSYLLYFNEHIWSATITTIIMLTYFFCYLNFATQPLWILSEKCVGIGWLLINMLMAITLISAIWGAVSLLLSFFEVDPITCIIAKILFALNIFMPDNNLIFIVLIGSLIFAITRCIKYRNGSFLAWNMVGLILCAIIVDVGGYICYKTFYGWDAFILILGLFPSLLSIFQSESSASSMSSESNSISRDARSGHIYNGYIRDGEGVDHYINDISETGFITCSDGTCWHSNGGSGSAWRSSWGR